MGSKCCKKRIGQLYERVAVPDNVCLSLCLYCHILQTPCGYNGSQRIALLLGEKSISPFIRNSANPHTISP